MSEVARIQRMLAVPKGRATVTISSPRGAHATFKIKRAGGKHEGRTFVEVPDESAQYGWRSVGEVVTAADLHVLRAYSGTSKPLASAINLVLLALDGAYDLDTVDDGPYRGPYVVQAADTCGACGRELTHPDSIPLGLGPECAHKIGVAHSYSSQHVRTQRAG